MTPFYITGFPRSRTAWLSSFFNHRSIACLHEPYGRVPIGEWDRVANTMKGIDMEYVGVSDTGLTLVQPEIVEILPGPAVVIVRDPHEVLRSLVDLLGENDMWEATVAATAKSIKKFIETYDPLVIPYEALEKEEVVKGVWHYLVPDAQWDQWWYEEMERKKVEVIVDRLLPKDFSYPSAPSDSLPPPPPPPSRYRER